jgi:hypothetical protein
VFIACNTAFHLPGTGNAYRKDDQGEQATFRSAIASSTRLLRGLDASGIMLPSRKSTGTTREAALLPERVGRTGVTRRATGETRPGPFSLPLAMHRPQPPAWEECHQDAQPSPARHGPDRNKEVCERMGVIPPLVGAKTQATGMSRTGAGRVRRALTGTSSSQSSPNFSKVNGQGIIKKWEEGK